MPKGDIQIKEVLLSTLEFQGYVKASLEAIKSDIEDIKRQTPSCMLRFEKIEQEQSKFKGIYLGASAVIGAISGFLGRLIK